MTDRATLILTAEDDSDPRCQWLVALTWGAIALAVIIFWAAMIFLAAGEWKEVAMRL